MVFRLSEDWRLQTAVFGIKDPETHFSAVIAHAYYAIFYAAKAYLLRKGIRTAAPKEHKKTFEAFKGFVNSGELDVELLRIYQEAVVRADALLGIFREEKRKRGQFTYRTLPQANKRPAAESLEHAKFFYKHLHLLCKG